MHKAFFILLFFFLTLPGFAVLPAGNAVEKPLQLKTDSAKVGRRNFDQQQLPVYRGQKDFIYDNVAPVQEDLWDRFWKWIWELIDRVLSNTYAGGFLKYSVIVVLAAVVIFVVIKMLGLDFRIFAGKAREVEVPYTETTDNIHEIDFNAEIDRAVAAGNYRLAVRLFYLYSLKRLDERAIISWMPEKTNQTYLAEIEDPDQRSQFGRLTRQFEFVWYGEFFIDKAHFNQVKLDFDRFNGKV